MLPEKLIYENKEISISEYCNDICPNRFDSECWSFCSLEMELREEDEFYEDDFDENET